MEIVSALRSALQQQVGRERYELWFGAGADLSLDGDRLVVTAPNLFLQEWLRRNFRAELQSAGQVVLGRPLSLDFQLATSAAPSAAAPMDTAPLTPPPPGPATAPRLSYSAPPCKADPQLAAKTVSPTAAIGRRFSSLDSFVVGDSNRLAHTTANMVAGRMGAWSPLVVHGPTGVGKTHLLEGVWSAVRKANPLSTAVFLSAEQFTSYFLEALRGSGLPNFRRKYRGVDLLIIDDVQFFAGKRATLVELLHTLDFLIEEGRQIVLSTDRPPAELDDLGRELVHRINAGMVCRIEPPEYDTRLGIVRRLAGKSGIRLNDDIIAYIAANLTGHARELSGAINRLHATHVALGEPINLAMAQETLAELIRYSARAVKLKDIELAICDVFGLERETLQSERRTKEISSPRMLAMWLARKHTRAALSEIGHYFGRRSHSTVVSAQKTVGGWMQSQQVLHVAQGRCTIDEAIRRVERLLQVG